MKTITLALCMVVISFGFAQNDWPSNFYGKTLDNGLELLVIEDNSVPLATIEIVVRNGAYTESPEYDGLSHLYEHMFFKANKDYASQEEFLARVRELGISFNGTTSTNRVNYFVTLNKRNLLKGLEFMNSAIRYPTFDPVEMKNENPVVDGEFQRAESNPAFFLQDDMSRALWGDLYSRKNTIGDHDIIKTATTAKMKIIQEKYYYPNNSLLAVAGDVDHNEVFKLAEQVYGDWEASDFDPHEKYPIPAFEPLTENKTYVTVNENARVPIIMIGWHGPDTSTDVKGTYTADIFSTILGQKTSKLNKELVDTGLALNVGLSYGTDIYSGPINLFLVPSPGKEKEALAKLMEHIDQWDSDDYFTDEQLQTAKDLMAVQDAYGKEQTSQFLHTVTYWWATADVDYYTGYVDNMNQTSRADIIEYVTKYIKGQPRVTGILVSPAMQTQMNVDEILAISK